MALNMGISGISAAMLTDPKALKKHLANGTPLPSRCEPSSSYARRSSEPPFSYLSFDSPILLDSSSQRARDDAYTVVESKDKKAISIQNRGSTPSNRFDADQLLDPTGFDKNKYQNDSHNTSTDIACIGQPSPSTLQRSAGHSGIDDHGGHKRDHEDCEVLGMGNFIERVHNVSQREKRPLKKQKLETQEKSEFDVEHGRRAISGGGGKGGEIGEYIKQKKKEGIAESGPSSAVVDLTGGMYRLAEQDTLDIDLHV